MADELALADINRIVEALQDPTRRTILLGFYADSTERTVDQVAAAAGVHRTVAFTHLERLAGLGYLATGKRRGRLGKPAKLYRLAGGPIELSHPLRRFSRLATLLVSALAGLGAAGTTAARDAGHRYGSTLVDGVARSVDQALERLAPLGAGYRHEPGSVVVASNCVFREACEASPEIVCELHAGLLEGALESAGVARRVIPIGRETVPRRCAYRLLPASG